MSCVRVYGLITFYEVQTMRRGEPSVVTSVTSAVCPGRRCWQCALCETPYDSEELQHALLSALQRGLTAFVLQDLQCCKCKQVLTGS